MDLLGSTFKSCFSILIALDLSTAFHTVDHSFLLDLLLHVSVLTGFSPHLVSLASVCQSSSGFCSEPPISLSPYPWVILFNPVACYTSTLCWWPQALSLCSKIIPTPSNPTSAWYGPSLPEIQHGQPKIHWTYKPPTPCTLCLICQHLSALSSNCCSTGFILNAPFIPHI